jgi:glycosyltransferase involved in cell wall biosynthesis
MIRENINPRISIVTPSYNQGDFIEETIQSVIGQEYPNLEYIIIDGGSTDKTIEVIKKYEKHLSYWVSEPDKGQSNAINKGIAHCTGEIFNWINSDDLLSPNALRTVAKAWEENPGKIISGSTEFFNESGVFQVVNASEQTLYNFIRFWESPGFHWAQQSTFVPLVALKKIGGVREDLKYCMDYNMMVRLLMEGLQVAYIKEILARFRFHSDSKTVGRTEEFRLERVEMLRNIPDLPIEVKHEEWNRQQAIRLVDVAKHAIGRGSFAKGLRLLIRAFANSPGGTVSEIFSRASQKLIRSIKRT